MDRRSVLALAVGAAVSGLKPLSPQACKSCANLPEVDQSFLHNQQEALASAYVELTANSPKSAGYPTDPVRTGMALDQAINWSLSFADYAQSAGLTGYFDQMLDPNDPMEIAPNADKALWGAGQLYQTLTSQPLNIAISYEEFAKACFCGNFQDGSQANIEFGGSYNALRYFATDVLPLAYPPGYNNGLAMARRKIAMRKAGPRSTVDCRGANRADAMLSTVVIGLGVATAFGCVICPILSVSHALPLMVVKIVKVAYC